jgi:hypothetical protein
MDIKNIKVELINFNLIAFSELRAIEQKLNNLKNHTDADLISFQEKNKNVIKKLDIKKRIIKTVIEKANKYRNTLTDNEDIIDKTNDISVDVKSELSSIKSEFREIIQDGSNKDILELMKEFEQYIVDNDLFKISHIEKTIEEEEIEIEETIIENKEEIFFDADPDVFNTEEMSISPQALRIKEVIDDLSYMLEHHEDVNNTSINKTIDEMDILLNNYSKNKVLSKGNTFTRLDKDDLGVILYLVKNVQKQQKQVIKNVNNSAAESNSQWEKDFVEIEVELAKRLQQIYQETFVVYNQRKIEENANTIK